MIFLSYEVGLYLQKSPIRPCMKFCCHVQAGAPSCYLDLLERLQKRVCRTVVLFLLPLELLTHCRNLASLSLFILKMFICFGLSGSTSLFSYGFLFVILIGCMIFLPPSLDVMSTVFFLAQLDSFACRMLSFNL